MHAIELSRERWHESIGTDHLLLAVLKVASRELIDAFESTGLRCNELADELARRNPPGKSPPPGPLEMLVKEYEKHPEFQALHQRIESLQQQQEDAVMRHDFIVAARLRDERLEVRRALTALIMSLRPPSRPETGSS
jgi:ATP-dependent Clp protease ATP-binding subunit ClpA